MLTINDSGIVYRGNTDKSAPPAHEVEIAKAWLKRFTLATAVPKLFSYGLKHTIEQSWPARGGGWGYICNGATIQAAVELGYAVKPQGLNAYIACTLRPDIARALKRAARPCDVPELYNMAWLPKGIKEYGN